MRTVFTNSEIMHVFNEQNQYEGRTSNNNVYFYDNKIYSYGSHYLLGEFIDDNTIVINDYGYNNITAKHIYLLTDATRDKKQFFTTKIYTAIVLDNVTLWLKKLTRARKTKEYYLNEIDNTLKMYFDYLEYTKQKTKYNKIKKHRKIKKIANDFYNNFEGLKEHVKEQQRKNAINSQDRKEQFKTTIEL